MAWRCSYHPGTTDHDSFECPGQALAEAPDDDHAHSWRCTGCGATITGSLSPNVLRQRIREALPNKDAPQGAETPAAPQPLNNLDVLETILKHLKHDAVWPDKYPKGQLTIAEAHAQITNLIADIIGEDETPGTAWDGNAGVRNNLRYKQRRRLEGR